jgi:hypothetical protein
MPSFEFGTSGVAFVLARLYEETQDPRFLDAAQRGAKHIQRISTVKGDPALLCYREPDEKNLFYLGYCGGPVGYSRLFYSLYQITGEHDYLAWVERYARGIMESGVPGHQTPGFGTWFANAAAQPESPIFSPAFGLLRVNPNTWPLRGR